MNIEILNNTSVETIIDIHNTFEREIGRDNNEIYNMSELDNVLIDTFEVSSNPILDSFYLGKFSKDINTFLDYFRFDGYGNLQGMSEKDAYEYSMLDFESKLEQLENRVCNIDHDVENGYSMY